MTGITHRQHTFKGSKKETNICLLKNEENGLYSTGHCYCDLFRFMRGEMSLIAYIRVHFDFSWKSQFSKHVQSTSLNITSLNRTFS